MPGTWRIRTTVIALAIGLLTAACGGDDAALTIDKAWARTSPMMADAGAVYFDIRSDDATAIVGASVDDTVAARAEVHETVMVDMSDDTMDDDMDDDMSDMGGAMTMQEVTSVPVAAGTTVSFEPGGLHVMLLELVEPLEVGDTFTLTLALENGDDLAFDVEVRDEAP